MKIDYIDIRVIFGDEKVDNLLNKVLYDNGYYAIEASNLDEAKALCSLFHTLNLKWRTGVSYIIKSEQNLLVDKKGGEIKIVQKRVINTYAVQIGKTFRPVYYFPNEGILRKDILKRSKAISFKKFLNLTLKYLKQ